MTTRIWHNTAEAARHARCHVDTVRKALESGELHGSQRKTKGRWRVHIDCLDAWCAGNPCEHKAAAA